MKKKDQHTKDSIYCQSCGLPFICDEKGTNFDGSLNTEFCKYCFRQGSFTNPNIDLKDMQKHVDKILKKKGFPPLMRRSFISTLAGLKAVENIN